MTKRLEPQMVETMNWAISKILRIHSQNKAKHTLNLVWANQNEASEAFVYFISQMHEQPLFSPLK